MAANTTIIAALLAGLVSFLSPCVLPLVPPYLVYLAGASLERLADAEPAPRVKREFAWRGRPGDNLIPLINHLGADCRLGPVVLPGHRFDRNPA